MGKVQVSRGCPKRVRRESARSAQLALAVGLFGLMFAAFAFSGTRPALAADPSPTLAPTFVAGRHVYDFGGLLSPAAAAQAEKLAAHIEAAGGGRVVVYTVGDNTSEPNQKTLAADWNVDGLLISGSQYTLESVIESKLTAKITTKQLSYLKGESSRSMQTNESWITSTLARADAFVSGTYVMDGAGVLSATGKQQAEDAVKQMTTYLGSPVYVEIAMGGDDPESVAFFNGAAMADHLGARLCIALAVDGGQIGGYIDADSAVWDSYKTASPWTSDTLSNTAIPSGDPQAEVLAAIKAVSKPPLIDSAVAGDIIPWIIFAVVIIIFSIAAPFTFGPWLIRKISGAQVPITGGLPGSAVIQSIADTGITITMPSVGPEAPEYKLDLEVTPAAGGTPYQATTKVIVPRIFVPQMVPGARIGVLIDPTDPQKVAVDFQNFNAGGADAAAFGAGGMSAYASGMASAADVPGVAGVPGQGGMDVNFDASGHPDIGQVNALLGAVGAGTMPMIKGSAAELLATGTHGTAVITSAQPMGKKVRDVNPRAEFSKLDDPMWLFTVEVSLAGQKPFPAIFGHRVPIAKVVEIGPGVKLAVSVGAADPSHDVAIDWDKSPIVG